MRRRVVKLGLPILGLLVAFSGVVYFNTDVPRLLSVLAGVLLVEAGTWKAANALLYKPRTHLELRGEVEDFLERVRALNRTATEIRTSDSREAWDRYASLLDEMHSDVERMGRVAGKQEGMGMADLEPPS